MTNYVRHPNRFLRPKREHITPLDRIQGKLRSLVVTGTVLLAETRVKETKRRATYRRHDRATASR